MARRARAKPQNISRLAAEHAARMRRIERQIARGLLTVDDVPKDVRHLLPTDRESK